MNLPVRHDANVELDEAITFHREEQPGLVLELSDAVADVISFAAELPRSVSRHLVKRSRS